MEDEQQHQPADEDNFHRQRHFECIRSHSFTKKHVVVSYADHRSPAVVRLPANKAPATDARQRLLGTVLLRSNSIHARLCELPFCFSIRYHVTAKYDDSPILHLGQEHVVSIGTPQLELDGDSNHFFAPDHVDADVHSRVANTNGSNCQATIGTIKLRGVCSTAVALSCIAQLLQQHPIESLEWCFCDDDGGGGDNYYSVDDDDAFQTTNALQHLHLEVTTQFLPILTHIVGALSSQHLQSFTLDWPLLDTNDTTKKQAFLVALQKYLQQQKGRVEEVQFRHWEDQTHPVHDFGHLPRLRLSWCHVFDCVSFVHAVRHVQSLSLWGCKFGSANNHLFFHTLTQLVSLPDDSCCCCLRQLDISHVRFQPFLSAQPFLCALRDSRVTDLTIRDDQMLAIVLPSLPTLGRLERLRTTTTAAVPWSIVRRCMLLEVKTIGGGDDDDDGAPIYPAVARRNRGLLLFTAATSPPPPQHLLPLALQQVAPCYYAATWTMQAMLQFDD